MATQFETLSLFAFVASKCNNSNLTLISIPTLLLSLATFTILLSLLFWSFPGGPAWGKHRLTSPSTTTSSIPGPRGLPILGSLSLMSGLAHRHLSSTASSLSATRLMSLSLGSTRVIISSHPDSARQILSSPSFSDRPIKESAYSLLFHRAIGFAPYGLYWRFLRRLSSNHLFSPKQLLSSSPFRSDLASSLSSSISESVNLAFPIRPLLKKASLLNMMSSVFGTKYSLDDQNDVVSNLQEMVDEGYDLLGGVNWSDHLPWLSPFDLQGTRFRCNQLVPRVNRFVGSIIDDHEANPEIDHLDFVDVLLSLPAPDRLSRSDTIAVLWEMIFRGTDTVAVLIEWILARMVLHPDVQSTVHAELDSVVGRSRAVTESVISNLPYLTAVIKETLRLHPPGPLLSWARLSVTDTHVDGHLIPAGTTAMVNMFAIARDPEFWPDPTRFMPERFISGSGLGPEFEFSVMGSDLRLAPFGAGRRSCPGKALGMATVSYWVATLMHEFEWMTSEEGATVDLSEVLKLSCEMAHPLMVRVRPRRTSGPSVVQA